MDEIRNYIIICAVICFYYFTRNFFNDIFNGRYIFKINLYRINLCVDKGKFIIKTNNWRNNYRSVWRNIWNKKFIKITIIF